MSEESLLFRIISIHLLKHKGVNDEYCILRMYIYYRTDQIDCISGGSFLGDDSQYNREKQAEYMVDVVVGGGANEISDAISDTILYGRNESVEMESTQFFEVLRFARQVFTQKVLDAIQLESKRPRASFMVLRRRILDVESHIDNGILRMDFIVDKERYPIRLSYRLGSQIFLQTRG